GDGASAGNIYVQDLPVDGKTPPFAGLTLYNSSFNPPSLRVAPGDVVDMRGTYQLFKGPSSAPFTAPAVLPELVSGTVTLRVAASPPAPITIPLADLATFETGKKW